MIIEQDIYDGDFIHKRFAYEQFRKDVSPVGNVVAFRAPMDVTTNLIDLEDTLSNDYIASADAINFCWEIPNLGPLGAVSFQRLFNTNIAKFLSKRIKVPIVMDGDDIMVQQSFVGSDGYEHELGKVSVSITYSLENVAVGHTAINIDAGDKAPGFAYSSYLTDEEAQSFMTEVIDYFNTEVKDQFVATTKIIV
tara:strand:+ start:3522 stop:4103 length:582 start_codon:yes stop_codon:yes gene_type:complete